MNNMGWLQLAVFVGALLALTKPLGLYLERVLDANQRMQSLLTDLLEFSRLSTRGDLFVEVELSEIIHEVLSDLEVRIERTGAKVQVGDLPLHPDEGESLFEERLDPIVERRNAQDISHVSPVHGGEVSDIRLRDKADFSPPPANRL